MRTGDARSLYSGTRTVYAVALLVLATAAFAGGASAPTLEDDRFRSTEDSVESFVRQLSDSQLKELYLRCSALADQRHLDPPEIEVCSVGSATLLGRVFKGDFDALLDWARSAEAHQ